MLYSFLILFKIAKFEAARITRGSAWSHTWFKVYHDNLGVSNRLLVWTNVGKLFLGGLEGHYVFNRSLPLQRR